MRRAHEIAAQTAVHPVAREPLDDQVGIFHGLGVGLAAPEREPKRFADDVARSLMVGVGVGQGMSADVLTAQLPQDAACGEPSPGVDEDVFHQVDVDRIGREPSELVETLGQAFHR